MADKKMRFIQVLIAASYDAWVAIESRTLSAAVWATLAHPNGERQPQQIITYQMPYLADPIACGLRDVWNNMFDEEHEQFAEQYPELATAIALMCGGNDEGKSGATSDSNSRRDDEAQSGSTGPDVVVEPGTGETTS